MSYHLMPGSTAGVNCEGTWNVNRYTIGEQSDSRHCNWYQPWMHVAKCVQGTP